MRHKKQEKKLGRTAAPRKALHKSLCNALVKNEKITTTSTKAKVVKSLVEKSITRGKTKSLVSQRMLLKIYTNENAKKILNTLAPKYKDRKGGYTRITKVSGSRSGDGAQMAIIEFV